MASNDDVDIVMHAGRPEWRTVRNAANTFEAPRDVGHAERLQGTPS